MHNDNWDDMRFILAVAETGTVSGAARDLGVNHATVLRRVAAFEARHGVDIFDRTSKGYQVKPERLRMVEAAREVGNAVRSMENLLQGTHAPLVGTVRVSSTDTFCQCVLPSVMRDFHNDVSGLQIALISTNAHSDLSRSQADIAVRPSLRLSDELTGEVAAHLGFGLYATSPQVSGWLGMTGALTRSAPSRWLIETARADEIVAAADSFVALTGLARQGLGRAVLPCCLGDREADLQRLDTPGDIASVPIWVACHQEMQGVARIAAVQRFLVEGLAARAERLAGLVSSPGES